MKLGKKKELAKRTLGVGKKRIAFAESRLEDIKEAITKQDIRDLYEEKAIYIKEKQGKKKVEGRKRRRKTGKVKKKVNTRKRDYVTMTRKLRMYVKHLKSNDKLTVEEFKDIRKKIRNKNFRSLSHLKDHINSIKKK